MAFQIVKISKTSILNDVKLTNGRLIHPYLYYITKINKTKVFHTTFHSNFYIREICFLNILLNKEFIAIFESTLVDEFLNGIELVYSNIPILEKILVVKEIYNHTPAEIESINSKFVLFATKLRQELFYLKTIGSISQLLSKKNCYLIFFDYLQDKIIEVDFEKYRNEDKLQLGLSLQELTFEDLENNIRLIENEKIKNFSSMMDILYIGNEFSGEKFSINYNNDKEFNVDKTSTNKYSEEIILKTEESIFQKQISDKTSVESNEIFRTSNFLNVNLNKQIKVYNLQLKNKYFMNNFFSELNITRQYKTISNRNNSENKCDNLKLDSSIKEIRKMIKKFRLEKGTIFSDLIYSINLK